MASNGRMLNPSGELRTRFRREQDRAYSIEVREAELQLAGCGPSTRSGQHLMAAIQTRLRRHVVCYPSCRAGTGRLSAAHPS